jgi:ABC-type uncharacterized transport system ATPase subunit
VLLETLDADTHEKTLATIPGVTHVESAGGVWRLGIQDGIPPDVAIRRIVAAVAPLRVEIHRPSLEDIFVEIVGGSSGATDEERQLLRSALRDDGGEPAGRAHE